MYFATAILETLAALVAPSESHPPCERKLEQSHLFEYIVDSMNTTGNIRGDS